MKYSHPSNRLTDSTFSRDYIEFVAALDSPDADSWVAMIDYLFGFGY